MATAGCRSGFLRVEGGGGGSGNIRIMKGNLYENPKPLNFEPCLLCWCHPWVCFDVIWLVSAMTIFDLHSP